MGNEISKKQFIIISAVIILITLVVIISIIKTKNNTQEEVSNNNNTLTSSENNNNNENTNNNNEVIGPNSIEETEIIPSQKNDTEKETNTNKDDEETNIKMVETSETLSKIQTRMEVTTDDNYKNILPEMQDLSDEEVKNIIGLDLTLVDDYIIRTSKNKFDATMYLVVKPSEGKETDVAKTLVSFMNKYTSSWKELNENNYQLLENKKDINRKGYLIFIVSKDNEALMNVIRQYI